MEKNMFYVVNLSHLKSSDAYITLWRPECKGYAWPLSWAGKYAEAEIRSQLDYYNSGENVAVPCAVLDALAVAPRPGDIDGDAGPVVLNTAEAWKAIKAALIATPQFKIRPKYPRKS
jgi:hypothetical protein